MVVRKVIFYKRHFHDFFNLQEKKVKLKINYVLELIRFEKKIPAKFLKYLENTSGIYEVRIITTFKNIRILCFFDQGEFVILMNCFLKKTQKVPRKEIKFAEKLKKEYLQKKHGG